MNNVTHPEPPLPAITAHVGPAIRRNTDTLGLLPCGFMFTRAELIDKAVKFMEAEFPDGRTGEYYARVGLMIHFITDITPE